MLKENRKVDTYVTKFKKLINRVNANSTAATLKNLNEAIAVARKVKAAVSKNELSDIKKRIKGLAILSAKLKDTEKIEYRKCGETGHIARYCILEKANTHIIIKEKKKKILTQQKKISFCELEDTNNKEVYIVNNITFTKSTK
ncbi:415_t:CDS:2 [Gigaspora margarita]|uniref:415_t:CDS:1 n=1 Tax=Gigaspora margarita TaxID=4874 RepID=A0ABN7VR18_GIGMA|nr:415_t:CDS:2 [Gigaspora margarita]